MAALVNATCHRRRRACSAQLRADRPEVYALIAELAASPRPTTTCGTEAAGTLAGGWYAAQATAYAEEFIAARPAAVGGSAKASSGAGPRRAPTTRGLSIREAIGRRRSPGFRHLLPQGWAASSWLWSTMWCRRGRRGTTGSRVRQAEAKARKRSAPGVSGEIVRATCRDIPQGVRGAGQDGRRGQAHRGPWLRCDRLGRS